MGQPVHFTSMDDVVAAFRQMKCGNWSFWSGRQLLYKYQSDDFEESCLALENWLSLMSDSTNAIYTLRFHEDLKGVISEKTPYNGSFNFRLNEETQLPSVGQYRQIGWSNELRETVKELSDKIAGIEKKIVEPVEQEEPMEWWERLLDHPLAAAVIGKVLNIDMGTVNSNAKIAGIPADDLDFDSVIDELEKLDPNLEAHLRKMLDMARRKPGDFKFLLSLLDSMKI